jgi:hypothetical protein
MIININICCMKYLILICSSLLLFSCSKPDRYIVSDKFTITQYRDSFGTSIDCFIHAYKDESMPSSVVEMFYVPFEIWQTLDTNSIINRDKILNYNEYTQFRRRLK